MQYVVPMYESESGWGAKIDGFAGPFESESLAEDFKLRFNKKYNNEPVVPSWYIAALDPVPYRDQTCNYRTDNV